MNADSQVICHLSTPEKVAVSDLAYVRRTSISKLVRALISNELAAAKLAAKQKRSAS